MAKGYSTFITDMGSSTIDNNGFRRQRANPISRIGVFPYRGDEIDFEGEFGLEKDKFYWVLRGPEELFAPEAIESFNGLPIRCGHVMLGDKPKTMVDTEKTKDIYKKVGGDNTIDGCIYNVRPSVDNPGFLIAEFCIYTDRMKDILKEGKIKELSLGYVCRYEREDGVFMGMPYQFKQVGLKGNHLALVKHGRCGSSVCVCDSAPDGAPVVVTFDSLPEGLNLMEDNKQEDKRLERAKALAAKIKGGDEQLALDCLDFADCSPEDRKAFLEARKGKKSEEKPVEEKTEKPTKDEEAPVPPEVPAKTDEAAAPAAAAASAPATPADTPDNPPTDVPSPKDGENPAPATDAAPTKDCGTAPATDCGTAPVKDCGTPPAQGVTEPTAQVPVAAVEAPAETPAEEDKPAEDKAPGCDCPKDTSKDGNCNTCGKPTEELKDKPAEEVVKQTDAEKPAEDSLGAGKPETLGAEKTPDLGAEETNEPKDPEKVIEPKKDKFAQDEYAAFAVEYANAQNLANSLRPHIKVAFDSTTMREIDVARFAAQHIPTLAFVQDEANDDIVLAAVRGHVAAFGKSAETVAQDALPEEAPADTEVPTMDKAVFEDFVAGNPMETPPAPAASPAAIRALKDYFNS